MSLLLPLASRKEALSIPGLNGEKLGETPGLPQAFALLPILSKTATAGSAKHRNTPAAAHVTTAAAADAETHGGSTPASSPSSSNSSNSPRRGSLSAAALALPLSLPVDYIRRYNDPDRLLSYDEVEQMARLGGVDLTGQASAASTAWREKDGARRHGVGRKRSPLEGSQEAASDLFHLRKGDEDEDSCAAYSI
uniref:Uncharacterized protein n=1 Tax=Chromera velia CCMP2878 TaxID=1169474 RepID=A0A0G4HDQ6_9ALVE|eukprot:Cvel_6417.t1-p1 / transcript=Cvel_6417.t1 / gene=Cvel_6417 / organism=Chromera_velia_CCMP2878 / gene_product=hypothetical protein / transcript_product=hypothetical protein / location=Cvel_scaffold314:13836-14414(-) / protein_length=193 / sequence_SO=supercontig / SO=protein_coding / is_pseudo=false